jgi:bifunctional non-homologous end joining protein LigD
VLPTIDHILPVISKHVPIGCELLYEAKLDGFRGTLYIESGRGLFRSKTRNRMKRFEPLAGELARATSVRDAIFDGEIVVMGAGGPDFDALFSSRGVPAFAAFDLLWLNGKDLRGLPLSRRKAKLRKLVATSPIGYVEAIADPRLYEAAVRMDLEGIVAKRKGDPYDSATQWIKVKTPGYSQAEGRGEKFHRPRS